MVWLGIGWQNAYTERLRQEHLHRIFTDCMHLKFHKEWMHELKKEGLGLEKKAVDGVCHEWLRYDMDRMRIEMGEFLYAKWYHFSMAFDYEGICEPHNAWCLPGLTPEQRGEVASLDRAKQQQEVASLLIAARKVCRSFIVGFSVLWEMIRVRHSVKPRNKTTLKMGKIVQLLAILFLVFHGMPIPANDAFE